MARKKIIKLSFVFISVALKMVGVGLPERVFGIILKYGYHIIYVILILHPSNSLVG